MTIAGKSPKLLSGGNPQIAKADGDAPVQAYISAMPGWKKDVGQQIDKLIEKVVPDVGKAVKWNSPFYGNQMGVWFLSIHCFEHFVRAKFFRGIALKPKPDGTSKQQNVRYLDIREDAFDQSRLSDWVKQASALPGEEL